MGSPPEVVLFPHSSLLVGSAAAAWQASIGSVVAGSLFAVLQSLTMTGVLYWIGGVMIFVGLIIPVIAHYWSKWFGGNDNDDKKDA